VAQAKTQSPPWKQGPHTADGAVKAIGEGPFDLVRGLLLKGNALELAIGLGEGYRTFGVAVAQVPDHAATDDGGQLHLLSQAPAVRFIGQDIDRQRQSTPSQHGHQALLPQRTDPAIEGHGRDVTDHRAPCQTESAVGGP
jgi:hypothetical protein